MTLLPLTRLATGEGIEGIAFSRRLSDQLRKCVLQGSVELPTGSFEGFVGWTIPARERRVAAHLDRSFGRLVERIFRRKLHDVEVLLVAVDAVCGILDTVSQQEQWLV